MEADTLTSPLATLEPSTDAAKCARWLTRMSGQPLATLKRGRCRVALASLHRSHVAHCTALGWTPLTLVRLSRALTACGVQAAPSRHAARWLTRHVRDWLAACDRAG